MRATYIILVAGFLAASSASGQTEPRDTIPSSSDTSLLDPRLKVGARVRVRASSLSPGDVVGRITEIRRDTLVIARGPGEPLTVPAAELSRLQVGSGDESVAVTLGLLGFLGGTAAYFSFCSHNAETCRKDIEEAQQDTTNTLALPSLYVVSAFGAALLGGAIGEAISPQRWNAIDRPLRFSLVPTRRGIMLVGSYAIGGHRRRSRREYRLAERNAMRVYRVSALPSAVRAQ